MTKALSSLLVVVALISLAACSSTERRAPETAAGPPIAVNTEVVRLADLQDSFVAPGTVRARTSAVIAAKVPGYVQEVKVKTGDVVRAGETLVVLHSQDLDAQVARAKAGQQVAASGVVEAEKARAAAESNAQLATSTYQRFKGLLEKRAVSRQEFEEVEARYKAASANLEMANAAIQRVREGEKQAQAEVKVTEVVRGYAVLSAPFAGVVTEKRVDPGSLAMPGQPLLVLEQGGDFRMEATVEESRIASIKLGDAVRVSIEVLPSEIQGKVNEIVPAVDPGSRTFIVKIDLRPTSAADTRLLRSGLFGRARFARGSRKAIAVPESALRSYGQLTSVYVAENGVAKQRMVTAGARSGGRVEILSGLSEGDRLVVTPPAALRDGARVVETSTTKSQSTRSHTKENLVNLVCFVPLLKLVYGAPASTLTGYPSGLPAGPATSFAAAAFEDDMPGLEGPPARRPALHSRTQSRTKTDFVNLVCFMPLWWNFRPEVSA